MYNEMMLKHKEVNSKRIEVDMSESPRKGAFGTVYKATFRGQQVAVKTLSSASQAQVEAAFEEACLLIKIDHDSVIGIRGVIRDKTAKDKNGVVLGCSILMPWKQEVLNAKFCKDVLSPRAKLDILLQVANALDALLSHNPPVLHRDLKGANVLVEKGNNRFKAFLADFGLAQGLDEEEKEGGGMVGTVPWMAPELFDGEPFSHACDVYSFGMLMWEVFACKRPWAGFQDSDIQDKLDEEKRPSLDEIPPPIAKVAKMCLDCPP